MPIDVQEQPRFVHEKSQQTFRRRFIDTGASNDLHCNLTELRAASDAGADNPDPDSQDVGFLRHNDFLGHLCRYFYASNQAKRLRPMTILDVGAGALQWPWFMHKNRFKFEDGAQYYALELRATANWLTATNHTGALKHQLKTDMHLVRCDLVRDDLSLIPEWPGQFDLVVCFETFEHVPRAEAPGMMQRLFNWTRPGGTCLFSTPNAGVSRSTAENHLEEDGSSREWTYDAKLDLAAEAGFELEHTYGTFTSLSYMPEEFHNRMANDKLLQAMKAFLDINMFDCVIASAYPEHSNNALMHFKRPASVPVNAPTV